MKKECKVVMLSAQGIDACRAPMYKDEDNNKLILNSKGELEVEYTDCEYQHLYITSNDKIKEGEECWVYNNLSKKPEKCTNYLWANSHGYKRIIATTDTSLVQNKKVIDRDEIGNIYNNVFLPQLSEDFIRRYVEEYNKGNVVEDVLVEYEPICCDKYSSCNNNCSVNEFNTKLRENNTIIISQVKPRVYTREEVIKLCESAYITGGKGARSMLQSFMHEDLTDYSFETWIKNNLK